MKRRLITVSLLSACALALPAPRVVAQDASTGRITGTITGTESNQPIQGVRITLLGTQLTVTSNPQGRYTIAGDRARLVHVAGEGVLGLAHEALAELHGHAWLHEVGEVVLEPVLVRQPLEFSLGLDHLRAPFVPSADGRPPRSPRAGSTPSLA